MNRNLREIYVYVLKAGFNIELEKVYKDQAHLMYVFRMSKKSVHHDVSGIIRLCESPICSQNSTGVTFTDFESTEDVFDTVKDLDNYGPNNTRNI
ncbi:hypothetical protein LCGC14_1647460 [marine sediment metagenome]|uniref:Uncharacterized protein n=1 Tax=marine sediment metagenome TaxID=412755 RepID=A0A0F9KXU7_9ZZZZ